MTTPALDDDHVSEPEAVFLGQLTKPYRKAHRLSQAEFARQASVSTRQVSDLENPDPDRPTEPRRATVEAIERVLGVRLRSVGGGKFVVLPGQPGVPNLQGVDVIQRGPDEAGYTFSISFRREDLAGKSPLEIELAFAKAKVAAIEAILGTDPNPTTSSSQPVDGL